MSTNIKKCFQILNIDCNATLQQIKSSYKNLILKYHPDKNIQNDVSSNHKFHEINTAYNVIIKHKTQSTNLNDVEFVDIYKYIYLIYTIFPILTMTPHDIILHVDVDIKEIFYNEIKNIKYKVKYGFNTYVTKNVYIDLTNYDQQYVFKQHGDHNIFTKQNSDLIVNINIVFKSEPNININNILDDYELVYNLKINLYEYFYGIDKCISFFNESIHIVYEKIYDSSCLYIKSHGLTYLNDENEYVKADLLIIFEVDLRKHKFILNNLHSKETIKQYFDI